MEEIASKIMSKKIGVFMKLIKLCVGLGMVLVLATCCSPKDNELVVYTSVDRVYSEVIFEAFTEERSSFLPLSFTLL